MVKWGKWCSLTGSWRGCCIVSELMEYASVSQKALWNKSHNRIWFQELKFHLKKWSLQTESPALLPLRIIKAHPGIMKYLSVKLHVWSLRKETDISFVHRSFHSWMDMLSIHPSCYESMSTGWEGIITSLKVLGAGSRAPAWVKAAGVQWTHIWLLKYKAGKLLVMISRWSQKVGIVSQGQSWIPPHVDESFRFPHCWSLFLRKVVFHFKFNFLQFFWLHHILTLKYHKTPWSTSSNLQQIWISVNAEFNF